MTSWLEDTIDKGEVIYYPWVIPEPVPGSVSVFLPLHTPDTGTGTFAVVSLEPAPTPVPAPSLEKLP